MRCFVTALVCLHAALLFACGRPQSQPNTSASSERSTASTGAGQASTVTGAPDACGFVGEVPNGPVGEDGLWDVPPANPHIRYVGRVDCSDPTAVAFAYPAVTIHARFSGDALDLKLRDHGVGGAQGTNYYDVSIDGAEPTALEVSPAQQIYVLARDLPAGEHTVEIVKRTESGLGGNAGAGKGELLGLRVREGTTLLPLASPARRLEFVGDSITCGYGNEASTNDPDNAPYTTRHSNANQSYGAIAARALGAEYQAVAYSGRGVSRNYMGFVGDTLPEMYLRILPDEPDSPLWKLTRYVPDVVVVNLGTNDFSPGGVDRDAYRSAYLGFLTRLREYYPQATLVTAVGPMLTDFYPPGERAWTNIQADVKQVVAARHAAGDSNVYYIAFSPQTGPYGEDWHPTVATHRRMASELVSMLQRLEGW